MAIKGAHKGKEPMMMSQYPSAKTRMNVQTREFAQWW